MESSCKIKKTFFNKNVFLDRIANFSFDQLLLLQLSASNDETSLYVHTYVHIFMCMHVHMYTRMHVRMYVKHI